MSVALAPASAGRWLAAAAVVAGLGGCAATPRPATVTGGGSCQIERVAELGARLAGGQLVVPVELDGQAAEFMVDTASGTTIVTPEAAQRLGLHRDPRRATLIHGAGGTAMSANAELERASLGGAGFDVESIAVGPLPSPPSAHVDGLLGADWLDRFEVELDIPQNRLGLWRATGCGPGFDPMAGQPHFALPVIRPPSGHVLVPVRLDGVGMFAFLDSGAAATVVTTAAASAAGVPPAALTADPGGTALGADLHGVAYHLHRFAELKVGPERFRGANLAVGELRVPLAGVLLGADYLTHHRVWISQAVAMVFVAPVR